MPHTAIYSRSFSLRWSISAPTNGGGTLENRARLLLDIVRTVRRVVDPTFTVAVKLNSADFQRGGFDSDDAAQVIAMLAPLGVDVVELSGGSYEAPAMTGQARTIAPSLGRPTF